jgi:MucR family transcriptional regulator, transcriptional regulator of exopolysaccharide biosynthesis
MAEESAAQKVDRSLVAEIVRSYVAHHNVSTAQLADLISRVHRSLSRLGQIAPPQELLIPAVPIRRSVQHDYVVCLECGFRGQAIRRHLSTKHGLAPQQYRTRWKLPADHPITAPAYSELRSTMAKQIGFGRKPAQIEAPSAPKRRGGPRRRSAV